MSSRAAKKQYAIDRTEYLKGEYERYSGLKYTEDDFLNWLIDVKRPTVAPGTWRVYRSWVKEVIQSKPNLERILKTKPAIKKRDLVKKRTSSTRAKFLTSEDLEALRKWSRECNREHAEVAIQWLEATLLTGLRPQEWMRSELIPHPEVPTAFAIRINNGKTKTDLSGIVQGVDDKFGRTHQVTRTISLENCDDRQISVISRQVELGGILNECELEDEGSFKVFYKKVSETVNAATRYSLGEREEYPCIYSARHQFASNLKATYKKLGYSKTKSEKMVAILMGQGSPKTSTYNYGLTRQGYSDSNELKPMDDEYEASFGTKIDKY